MSSAAPQGRTDERRRAERTRLCRAAQLRPNGWSRFEVDLIDISPRGFRARCDALLKTGSYVSLEIPGVGNVDARLIWRRNGEIGAQFVQPVDLAHCAWFGRTAAAEVVPGPLVAALASRVGAAVPEPD